MCVCKACSCCFYDMQDSSAYVLSFVIMNLLFFFSSTMVVHFMMSIVAVFINLSA